MKKYKYLFILHCIIAMYSAGSIFSKLASSERVFSLSWLSFYGIVLLFLFIYAIAWQQIIKKIPIVTAYSNKAVMVIWGIVWGYLFFGESITISKVFGAVIIIVGVYLIVSDGSLNDN